MKKFTGRYTTNTAKALKGSERILCQVSEDGTIYIASEDATRKDPLLLALIDFSRVYTHFLVSNTADYNAAPWGTI